jgi:hypothetical protein
VQVIWKYQLKVQDEQIVSMPEDAKILCIQAQREKPCLSVIIKTEKISKPVDRTFLMYGTGHTHEKIEGDYIGTFQLHNGRLVFHLFEKERREIENN